MMLAKQLYACMRVLHPSGILGENLVQGQLGVCVCIPFLVFFLMQ
jgi:hypothetical protein